MPQFNPTFFPSQIFWLAVTFVVLYLIIAHFVIPRVGEILEQRARLIQDDLDRAQTLKASSDAALATYEKAMADARAQARDVLLAISASMKTLVDQKTAAVNAEVGKQIADAEARIAAARQDALAQIKTIAADTAREAVGKLAGLTVDASKLDAAVAGAMKDMR